MIATLDDVLDFLDGIPNINAGGCGVSALAIYRWCKAHDIEIDSEPFVLLCNDGDELRANNRYIRKGDFQSTSIPHIVTKIGDRLWDSTGSDLDGEGWIAHHVYECNPFGEDGLVQMLNENGWNFSFERDEWLPIIAGKLEIDLSDVEANAPLYRSLF